MNKKTIKFAVLVAVLVSLAAAVYLTGLGEYLDQDRLRAWIDGFGGLGPVVFIIIYSLAPAFLLPGLPLTVAGGVLFGPVWGVVYVAIGSTIGATVAFLVARYMGREWVAGMLSGGRLATLDEEVEKKGWKIVAFTRLIPVFPFNLLNYAFGLTKIKLSHYVVTSFICMLPAIIAFVVFSSSILDVMKGKVSVELIVGVVLIVVVSLIPIIYKKRKGKKAADGD